MTIVEPGGARTEFRYGSAQVAKLMPIYDQNPAHSFMRMLDPKNGLTPGDPTRMAARIIESVDVEPAPLRMVLGSQMSIAKWRPENRLCPHQHRRTLSRVKPVWA
jgi:hypothetical protein